MATTERSTAPALEIRRTFKAAPGRVYEAWTDPKELTRWFCPSDDVTLTVLELDLRVGGSYRFEMRGERGVHIVTGTYRELSPPGRLAFTWRWMERPDMKDSVVTIDLADRNGGTEMVLVHAQLATEEDRENHGKGWQGCLDRLARIA